MALSRAVRQRFWRFCVSVQRFVSLFCAPEIGWLLLVFGVTWFISLCAQNFNVWDSFCFLFSLDKGIGGWWVRLFSGMVFFVVWLIGGGVLVSVLVAQRRRNDNGEFRLGLCLLRNHVVFLGWDENAPAFMQKELHEGDNKDKKIFIVVTMNDVDDVVKTVAAANVEKWRLFVYRGFYDDDRERECLNIGESSAIYIIGESREDSHDSRVFLLANNMRAFVENSKVPVCVNIRDFGLANRLIVNAGKDSLKNIRCLNFHLDSAFAMLNKMKCMKPFTCMAVIGFGAMGKAVVISAFELSMVRSIFISDDDNDKLDMEKARFDKQFPAYSADVNKCMYSDCMDMLRTAQQNDKWLVVIAKHRSEKGLFVLGDVLSAIGNKENFSVVLNQEVKCDFWHDDKIDQSTITIDGRKIELFGFKGGDVANEDG